MKRQANLLVFAFFGLFAQATLLLLLEKWGFEQAVLGFLLSANCFMIYRVLIEEKKSEEKEGFLKKELRRWWIRREPENSISFAFVGGMILVFCNNWLWQETRMLDIWAMGFVAVGLSQVLFEQARKAVNKFNAYLLCKKKQRIAKMVLGVKQDGYYQRTDKVCH